jgi:ethanolamine utilization protein EutA
MRQQGMRYVVTRREVLSESEILLTPYRDDLTIDVDALGEFIARQYARAGLQREEIDTGALILTGVAVRRRNARAIAELFASEAGRFVAVSAGDSLESTMAAHGSGAAAESGRTGNVCMNVDIGGGTSKIAICIGGRVREVTALDVGARLIVLDAAGVVTRLEDAGKLYAQAVGLDLAVGRKADRAKLPALVSLMADRLFEIIGLKATAEEHRKLLRLPPLSYRGKVDALTFSGGVSEFIYGGAAADFGDMGALLAREVKERAARLGVAVREPAAKIRATVIGASQYTIQVSGSTIFIDPLDAVPLRNIPVIAPEFLLSADDIDPSAVADAIGRALKRLDLFDGKRAVAVGYHWDGSATFARLQAFCSGVERGVKPMLDRGFPLILVNDGDVGGTFGLHFKEEMKVGYPVVSIDGIALSEFDYVDIGALIPSSGAVPVVIKSLVFPAAASAA